MYRKVAKTSFDEENVAVQNSLINVTHYNGSSNKCTRFVQLEVYFTLSPIELFSSKNLSEMTNMSCFSPLTTFLGVWLEAEAPPSSSISLS